MRADFFDFNTAHFLDALAVEYRARGYRVEFLPFVYGADFLPIAIGATASRPVTIEHDSDFVLSHLTAVGHDAAGNTLERPNATVALVNETSQRAFQNQAAHLGNMFGTGPEPAALYKPLILPAKTSISVTVQNIDTVDLRLRLSFVGVKAFLQHAG